MMIEAAISGTGRARHSRFREGVEAMVLSNTSVPGVPSRDPRFALYYDPWVRTLLKLIPGALERSGVAVTDEDVRMRLSPGTEVYIPRNSIMRVWRTHRGGLGIQSRLPHFFGVHTNFSGLWWMNGSTDNLVVLDIDPPVTGRVWGVRINPRRLILSLEDPEGFIAEVLRS